MNSDRDVSAEPLRLLVIAAQAAKGDELREQLSTLAGDRPLELRVVAPAYAQSRLQSVLGDVDEGIGLARDRLDESVGEMNRDQGTTAQGDVGEADPLIAIEDALGSFPAEEIVIIPAREGDDQWAEKDLFEKVKERFDLPVRQIQLESGDQAKPGPHPG
jgi:hypothetical protein